MSNCDNFYMSGIGACEALRKPLKGIILMTRGTTLTLANARLLGANTTGWASIINQPRAAGVVTAKGLYLDITRGIESTTTEAEMTMSNLKKEEQTDVPTIGATVFGSISYADYLLWVKANGQTLQAALVDSDGNVTGTITSTGAFKGFTCRLYTSITIPTTTADMQKQAPFMLKFDVYEEFENQYTAITNCTFQELKDLNPIGCTGEVATAYVTGTGVVVLKVTTRGGTTPVTTMGATTNWEVLDPGNNASITIGGLEGSDEGIGIYSMTLNTGLTGKIIIRGFVETQTAWTYTTNPIEIICS